MNLREKLFVEVRKGTKVTLSESDLNKMDRMYERELAQYDNRKVMTPYRKEPKRAFLAQLRDYAFERILDRHLYTFSHVLVIPNPYGVAKQTALILFNSSKEYKVRYRVFGDNGNDFVGESSYTTRHRVAILGLYFEQVGSGRSGNLFCNGAGITAVREIDDKYFLIDPLFLSGNG